MRKSLFAISCCLLLGVSGAWATPCPATGGWDPAISDNVTPSDDCELGSTNNDFVGGTDPSMHQVNLDMMFGFDDWVYAEKAIDDEVKVDIGLTVTGGSMGVTINGTWAIDDIWTSLGISALMLVFKDGSGEPDTYVGYLITPNATMGDYLTPFINPMAMGGAGAPKDISHITAYYRTGGMPMPVPGTLALIAIGLLAGARVIRRRG